MKKFGILGLILLVMIALSAGPGAQAQRIGSPRALVSQSVAGGASVAVTNGVDVSQWDTENFQLTLVGTGADTGAVVVTLQKSIDGTTFVSAGTLTANVSGTSTSSVITSVAAPDCQWLRLVSVNNSANATNVTVTLTASPGKTYVRQDATISAAGLRLSGGANVGTLTATAGQLTTASIGTATITTGSVVALTIGTSNYTLGVAAIVDTSGSTNQVLKLSP